MSRPGIRQRVGRHRPLLLSAAVLLLAGCASAPREFTPLPRAEPGTALGGRPVALPAVHERLVHVALQEWTLWGRARWHLHEGRLDQPSGPAAPTEDLPPYTSRVLHYWYALQGREFGPAQPLYADGSLLPWSAVFVSYLAKTAGLSSEQFPPSASHWGYIRAALEPAERRAGGFEALDAARIAPMLADLICAPREGAMQQLSRFEQLQDLSRSQRQRHWPFHCDLVVSLQPGLLGAVGGNVEERVLLTQVALDTQGLLRPHAERPWLVILRQRASAGP